MTCQHYKRVDRENDEMMKSAILCYIYYLLYTNAEMYVGSYFVCVCYTHDFL